MSALTRAVVAIALACSVARAQPPEPPKPPEPIASRVVLADPDPELARALTTALAPWHLEVVVDANTPADDNQAQARADAGAARFVVWRNHRDLVVFDREVGIAEHRDAPDGPLDAVSAAAAALTVKTLMRLPPPPDETPPAPPPGDGTAVVATTETPAAPEVRVQAGAATRIARGSDTDVSARFAGAVLVRLFDAWHFGVTGDLGTRSDVDRAGFKGTWNDWAVLGVASWTAALGSWELEPHLAFGVARSTLAGEEMGLARSEGATLAVARAGLWVRYRYDMWTIGGTFDLERGFGTPTYTRTNTNVEIFQVPSMGVSLGLILAADLGR